jgi:hypothetical protein
MGYEYNAISLNHRVDNSTTSYSNNVLNNEGVIAFGELCQLVYTITHTSAGAKFTVGRAFVFNPCLFAATQYSVPLIFAEGYLLEIGGTSGALTVAVRTIGLTANSVSNQNLSVSASISVTDKIMTITHTFYATADVKSYLGQNYVGNDFKLQNSDVGTPQFSVAGSNIYSLNDCYLEAMIYEADATTFTPRTTGGLYADPYVRDTSNPSRKQVSRLFKGKFFDNEVGNIQAFTAAPLTFDYNSLKVFQVRDTATANVIFTLTRLDSPQLDSSIDNNFSLTQGNSTSIQLGAWNDLKIKVEQGTINTVTPTQVALTLIDCTATNFHQTQLFTLEYKLDRALIPFANATPAPNWLNSGTSFFGTPSSVVLGGSEIAIDCTTDGSKLIAQHRYRVLVQIYDSAAKIVSTHVSPAFIVADLEETLRPTITGTIETLNDSWNGNEVTIAPYERVKLSIDCDDTAYPNFTTELQKITLTSVYADGTTIASTYDFSTGIATGLPLISYTNSAPNHIFECEFRPYCYGLIAAHNSTHTWQLKSLRTMSNGSQFTDLTTFEQRLTVSALDVARIVALRLLDYSDYEIGVFTYINQLCQDDDKVVIEVEKSGVPDAKLVALFLTSNPNVQPQIGVEEEETFASATTLPVTTSVLLEDVEATFTDDFAYYVIDLTQLQQLQGSIYYFGALIYDI